jgi:hypothetical protein
MLKILLIEDEPESIETLVEELKRKFEGSRCEVKGFEEAESHLRNFLPDLVILDIFRGSAAADGDTKGLENYDFIWNECFCPIVIYSACPQYVSTKIQEHPFISCVQKGKDSEFKVISCVEEFAPHIEALNNVQKDIRQHINRQLKGIAPVVFDKITDVEARKAVFSRTARRRVAAMMDQPADERIASWEQYLYPPVGSHLLAGDIIKKRSGDKDDPNSYYVVLTPSCDLVDSEERGANVEKALVAQCASIENMLPEIGTSSSTRADRLKEKLLPFLRRGFGSFCLPLPELPHVLPAMTAELKNLELIRLDRISNDTQKEYYRVASVDSPFREMIIWAYIQITGRPGLPERDFDTWAGEICSAVAPKAERGGSK